MSANPALGAVLLVGYSYAVVGAIYFGTRAALRCCTETTLRFPFYPLALANLAVCALVLVTLLVPGAFFTAGIGLILLQFMASVALGVVYVVADLVYGLLRASRARRDGGRRRPPDARRRPAHAPVITRPRCPRGGGRRPRRRTGRGSAPCRT